VGRTYNCWMLNLLVHHVTRRLEALNISTWRHKNHDTTSACFDFHYAFFHGIPTYYFYNEPLKFLVVVHSNKHDQCSKNLFIVSGFITHNVSQNEFFTVTTWGSGGMAPIMVDPLKGTSPPIQGLSLANMSSAVRTPHHRNTSCQKQTSSQKCVNVSVNFLLLHFRAWGLHTAMPVDNVAW
jgi:hypothetical protein